MTPRELAVLRDKVARVRLAREAERSEASMYATVRCPVHRRIVSVVDGRIQGRCDECCREAASAILDIQQGVAAARQWAGETLRGDAA